MIRHARAPSVGASLMRLCAAAGRTVSSAAPTTEPTSIGAQCQRELAGDDARDVEQIRHELRLRMRVAIDDGERPPRALLVENAVEQHARPSDDGVQRRAQLVRQRGEKLVFRPVGCLGFAACGQLGVEQRATLTLGVHPFGGVADKSREDAAAPSARA